MELLVHGHGDPLGGGLVVLAHLGEGRCDRDITLRAKACDARCDARSNESWDPLTEGVHGSLQIIEGDRHG